jgi:hypothetical protein
MQPADTRSRALWTLLLALAGAAGEPALRAQPFEYLYGQAAVRETQGNHGVEEVNTCPGGGYVAVSSAWDSNGTGDIYVVRTNPNGSRLWELTYDVTPTGGRTWSNDQGFAIAELPAGGFVVTGATDVGGPTTDVYLLRLDCNGGVTAFTTYPAGGNDVGRDVLVAANGDFVVAGWTDGGITGTQDGLLLRATAAGAPIWMLSYDVFLGNDILYGVTEATVAGAGDLIASGNTTAAGGTRQGWMLRTSPTGILGPPPQGSVQIGGPGNDDFVSVKERTLTSGGNLVFLGSTTSGASGGLADIYVVETGPWPCGVILDRQIGDANGSIDEDYGTDLVEATNLANPTAIVPLGDLAITGATTNGHGLGAYEAILLPILASPLNFPGPGFVFGDHGSGSDGGFSINQTINGFVIAGWSDFHPADPADSRDLYLVRTNSAGHTCCQLPWNPTSFVPSHPFSCATPSFMPVQTFPALQKVRRISQLTAIKACIAQCPFP